MLHSLAQPLVNPLFTCLLPEFRLWPGSCSTMLPWDPEVRCVIVCARDTLIPSLHRNSQNGICYCSVWWSIQPLPSTVAFGKASDINIIDETNLCPMVTMGSSHVTTGALIGPKRQLCSYGFIVYFKADFPCQMEVEQGEFGTT